MSRAIPTASRRALALRAGCAPGESCETSCHYCGTSGFVFWHRLFSGRPSFWVTFRGLEMDHVLPRSAGGTADPANLVLACRRCNRSKGARLLETA